MKALSCVLCVACASTGQPHVDDAALAEDMASAATAFLASLTPEQADRARFPLEHAQRTDWHYIPRARPGVSLGELAHAPRALAYGFLATALGRRGLLKASAIMALEEVLYRREHGSGPFVRDPGAYFLTIFGTPSTTTTWGWRIEGHHLSINLTLVDGRQPIAAPAFLGAAPSTSRVLGREELLGLQLLSSLDDERRRVAVYTATAPDDILTGPDTVLGELPGLAVGRMTSAQRASFAALLDELLATLPPELAARERALIAAHDIERVTFTWAGAASRELPHYFRLSGPTFLYEFDNTQEQATHVHTVWHARSPAGGDFGTDLLREHYRNHPHGAHR
ncbi:MAG: DUF3500 domain-containing protein [Kofleriaceae bacterium]|nr:DUF3500 domain-containing protein [Kofleriaceae bacterium]